MEAFLPTSIDLNKLIADYPPGDHEIQSFNADHAYYVLDLITSIPARNKKIASTKGSMVDSYTPIYSVRLQSVVHGYRKYLNYFIDTGIIESDDLYVPGPGSGKGSKCIWYRFTHQHLNSDMHTIGYGEKFQKILTKKRNERFRELRKDYPHLIKWIWPECGLQIDAELARKYLSAVRRAKLGNASLRDVKTNPIYKNKIEKDPNIQYKFALSNVELIASGRIDCTVDKEGRMHTVLTNMKSDLRNLVTYKGAPMVSIDIKNSQPYLAATLTRLNKPQRGRPTINSLIKHINNNKPQTQHILTLMLEDLRELSEKQDFIRYANLVKGISEDGGNDDEDLYTFMQKEGQKRDLHFSSRSEVKVGVFEVLFSKNGNNTKAKKLFRELFPSVDKIFRKLKEEDHAMLPCLLQTIESFIMLHVITKKVSKRFPNAPIFTIHDSIVTTEEYSDGVEKIMYDELTKIVGIPPMLKVDRWSPDNLNWGFAHTDKRNLLLA